MFGGESTKAGAGENVKEMSQSYEDEEFTADHYNLKTKSVKEKKDDDKEISEADERNKAKSKRVKEKKADDKTISEGVQRKKHKAGDHSKTQPESEVEFSISNRMKNKGVQKEDQPEGCPYDVFRDPIKVIRWQNKRLALLNAELARAMEELKKYR